MAGRPLLITGIVISTCILSIVAEQSCAPGEELHEGLCVPVTCLSENACPDSVCFPAIRTCIRAPCPQYACCSPGEEYGAAVQKCYPVTCEAKSACEPGFVCVPKDGFCLVGCQKFACRKLVCPDGEERHQDGSCVPITCQSKNACDSDEQCIEENRTCLLTAPCQQFRCKKVSCLENSTVCGENGRTYPNKCMAVAENVTVVSQGECTPCITSDGILHKSDESWTSDFCGNTCSCNQGNIVCTTLDCPECPIGEERNATGFCVPVSCESLNACGNNRICKAISKVCAMYPCPKFICEVDNSCKLDNNVSVPHGWLGPNTGDKKCQLCACLHGQLRCSVCTTTAMVSIADACTLDGGEKVPDGWSGRNTGESCCNKCNCNQSLLTCTNYQCGDCTYNDCHSRSLKSGEPCSFCDLSKSFDPFRPCSEIVAPKKCASDLNGKLFCELVIDDSPKNTTSCTLSGGETVFDGWEGQNTGEECCNKCRCSKGVLTCFVSKCHCTPPYNDCIARNLSEGDFCKFCSIDDKDCLEIMVMKACVRGIDDELACKIHEGPFPTNPPPTCKLNGGESKPVGWSGKNTGNDCCNTCTCERGGKLQCSVKGCPVCPEPVCTLSNNETVPEGWVGKTVGTMCCDKCTCLDGELSCDQCSDCTGGNSDDKSKSTNPTVVVVIVVLVIVFLVLVAIIGAARRRMGRATLNPPVANPVYQLP
eukprot:m.30067 g.30067  ORF g.30067 m.30067 type:complete len:707 (+) comp8169_c0_seq2:297-2417(+)